ncbi:heterocyst frequency control protein PatD [Laspinema sp. A4]|uniref:heterocyst frequency control protein PatD n=1 Tax=Laspinema sp. D2d TaxID=2953686 RepID=UPI0021BB3D94|nr:heterocyst frequency control protein PatD [Laspinema sp. D2d]MCT7984597.1 heterocyst frequency control protein PatD [Laspinema sp. D2d]
MLPDLHTQCYQNLMQALSQLSETVNGPNPDQATVRASTLEIQQLFQDQILSLGMDELEPGMVSLVQSFQTELHKQIRLLGNDVIFLVSARQAETRERRWSEVRDRLKGCIGYCEAILSIPAPN